MDVWAASPGRKRKRMADPARVAGGRKGEKLDGVRLTATFDPTITLPAQPPRAPPAGTPSTSQADLLLNSLGISQGSASVLQLAAAMGLGRGGVSPSVGGLALPPPVPQLAVSASDMTAGSKSSTLLQPLYRSGSGRFCSKCGAPRVDVRFPCCQAGYHARCVYPWPVVTCPTCAKHVSCVTIVSVEPLVRNGVTIPVPQGTTRLRGGRWCEAEVKYAESVIEAFNTGLLPISEGTRLGSLLCNLLQCTPARLSSKLRTGKKNFHYLRGAVSAQQVYSYEQHQRKLSEQEELFLHYIPAEEAAAASSSFQLEWRIQFIGQAKRLGQRIDNLHEWAGLVNEHREADELRSSLPDGVDDDNDSDSVSASVDGESLSAAYGVEGGGGKMSRRSKKVGAKTSAAMAAGTALGTLMCTLVRISADRRQRFTVQDGVSTATTFDDMLSLLKAGSEFECSLLARASNWSILFASAGLKKMLGRDDGDLLGSPLAESSANGLVHPSDVMALEVACNQSRKDVGVLLEQLGNPRSQLVESELSLVPVALRLRRRHGAFIERYFSVFATDMFVLLHGSVAEVEPGSQSEYQALGLAGLGALSADVRAVKHPGVDRGVEGMTGAAAGVPQPAMARSRASSFSAPGAPGLPMSSTPTNSLQPTPSPALPASSSSSPSNAVVQTAAAAMLSMQRALGGNAISTITTTTSNPHQSVDLGPALVLPPAPPHIQPMMTMQPQQPSQLQQHHFAQSMGVTPSSSLTTTSSYTPTSTASADDTALTAFMAQVARVAGQSREDDQHTKEWDETLDWSNHDDEDAGLIPLSCTFTNQSSSTDDACVGAYDLCYAPPASFEQTMRTFLIGLPFEAVDIWVPTRNPNGNGLSLQFGGGVALRSDLHQWIFYSRTFEFLAGQGMPGRVFQFMRPEYQEDVCLLDNSLFLRKEGAREAGVHVSFGLPIGQNEHTFVLLFYSSKRSSITQEVLDFIRRSTSSWRISTTLEGGSEWCGSGSSSPSASPRQGPSAQGPLLLHQQQKQQQQQPQQAMVPWLRRVPLAVPPPAHQHQGATLFEGSMSMASHNSPMAPTTQHHANVNSFGGGDGGAGGGPVGRYSV